MKAINVYIGVSLACYQFLLPYIYTQIIVLYHRSGFFNITTFI